MSAPTFPQAVYDINHNFGEDIQLSAQNDLQNVSDLVRSQQRVLRRLLTPTGSYIWHPEYGAGLPAFVGKDLSSDRFDQIKSLITSQIFFGRFGSNKSCAGNFIADHTGRLICANQLYRKCFQAAHCFNI